VDGTRAPGLGCVAASGARAARTWRASKGTGQRGSRRASRAFAFVAGEAVGPPWRGAEARARAGESKGGVVARRRRIEGRESCLWGRLVSGTERGVRGCGAWAVQAARAERVG